MLRALVGPTASGKTEAGIALAAALGAEIVSVDSMLVYRGMDVGTAKPTAEQRAACRTTCSTSRSPRSGSRSPGSRREAHAVLETVAATRSSSGGRACTSGRWSTTCGSRRRIRPSGPSLEAEADALGADELYARLAAADPVAAARIEPGERPPHDPRARGLGDHRRAVQRLRRGVGGV